MIPPMLRSATPVSMMLAVTVQPSVHPRIHILFSNTVRF
jgi:hypothetical protein